MKRVEKLLLGISLSSLLFTGCISFSGTSDTLSAEQIPISQVSDYYLTLRTQIKSGPEKYKTDLLFTQQMAQEEHKSFFEFDGNTYRSDDTAIPQMEALIAARKQGKTTYVFNGQTHSACSGYPADEQMEVFGNLWEELSSPQDSTTKGLIRDYVEHSFSHLRGQKYSIMNRLYEVCRLCGYPEIRDQAKENSMMGKLIKSAYGQEQSFYSPEVFGRGVIYLAPKSDALKGKIPDYDSIISELAHAFREKSNLFGEKVHFITDGFKDLLTFSSPGFGPNAQQKNYQNPARMEHDAHKIVEPALQAYILNPFLSVENLYITIQKNRELANNTYTLTPSARKLATGTPHKATEVPFPLLGYRRLINTAGD